MDTQPQTRNKMINNWITKKEPKTVVVRLRRKAGVIVQSCDVYIGRHCSMGGWNLAQSKWGNPYTKKNCPGESPEEILEKYKSYVLGSPELMASLWGLKGKRLGCWCKPKLCHGDALVALVLEHCK